MDHRLVESIRKSLEVKSTPEIRQAYQSGDEATRSPEEMEAMRQVLDERSRPRNRAVIALSAAVVMGVIGAAAVWWQGSSGELVFLAGIVCAIVGAASFYIRDLIPFGRL
jgi:hypothetical protein